MAFLSKHAYMPAYIPQDSEQETFLLPHPPCLPNNDTNTAYYDKCYVSVHDFVYTFPEAHGSVSAKVLGLCLTAYYPTAFRDIQILISSTVKK